MGTRILFVVVFIAGVSSGWLANTWLAAPAQTGITANATDNNQQPGNQGNDLFADSTQALESTITDSNNAFTANQNLSTFYPREQQLAEAQAAGITVFEHFDNLLNGRLYFEAMNLYQEQVQQNNPTTTQLKKAILDHLKLLSETRRNNDFSDLVENYLSIYYDDIDIILLLADFDRSNGSYLEAVDVYLLAKTYAYTDADQQRVPAVHRQEFL